MAKASDNAFPSILIEEHVDPAAPAAGHKRLFIDTDHKLKSIDSSSAVVDFTPTGLLNKYDATAAPAVTDDSGDGYSVGSIWVDVTGDAAYICVDASVGAAVWNPFEGAGSGAFLGLPLDEPPASAHAKDDEFNGSSLDGKWTNPLTAAVAACGITVEDGLLKLQASETSKHMYGIRQAAPTGSFTVMAKISYLGTATYDVRAGLLAYVAGSQGHVLGPFVFNDQTGYIGVGTTHNTNDWSSYDGTTATSHGSGRFAWVRLVWSTAASTITCDHSKDGVNWINLNSRGSMSQPDFIGLGIYLNSAPDNGTNSYLWVDWFRVTEP